MKNEWKLLVKKLRKQNPNKSFKEVLILAKKQYKKDKKSKECK